MTAFPRTSSPYFVLPSLSCLLFDFLPFLMTLTTSRTRSSLVERERRGRPGIRWAKKKRKRSRECAQPGNLVAAAAPVCQLRAVYRLVPIEACVPVGVLRGGSLPRVPRGESEPVERRRVRGERGRGRWPCEAVGRHSKHASPGRSRAPLSTSCGVALALRLS